MAPGPSRYPRTVTDAHPEALPERIFHIATAADWRATLATGTYTTSTVGRSLAEEGFIHASRREQVQGVFDRYYRVEGRPSLGSRGGLARASELTMVDEWLGCELTIGCATPAAIGWAPVETVSLSESGFERIYQGSALLFSWPVALGPAESWETSLRVRVGQVPAAAAESGDSA